MLMKKFLLTLTIMMSVMVLSAQKFIVNDADGNAVESGASFVVYGDGSELWGEIGGEMQIEFSVVCNEDMRVVGRKTPTNFVEGTSTWICFGQCLAPSPEIQETEPYMVYTGDTLLLSGHYMADNYLTVLGEEQHITLEIWDGATPEDVFSINVVFKYSLEGVEENSIVESFSNAYPSPANSTVYFDYSFTTNASAAIAIYNMMGQEVLRNDISGISGKASVNVSDLTDGVYFYSLIVNGVAEKSSKLVVRH